MPIAISWSILDIRGSAVHALATVRHTVDPYLCVACDQIQLISLRYIDLQQRRRLQIAIQYYYTLCISSSRLLDRFPSRHRISGSAEFCPAAKNPPKKMRPPKTPPNFRKSVSRRKIPAKFGWVGRYRKCINWLSFTCPHLLLQTMLNACSVPYSGMGLVANGKWSNLSAK